MRFKKVYIDSTKRHCIAIEKNDTWHLLEDCDKDLEELLSLSASEITAKYKLVDFPSDGYKEVIPFMPSAYRDFYLYEKHALDAARGFVKKYMPKFLSFIDFYKKITGKPFPKLKPKARYYEYPIYYMGNHLNFISNGEGLAIPTYTKELDYELELAAVISKPLKNASVDKVADAIGGFVVLNDFSARDVQLSEMETGFGPMKTKNFANAISIEVAHRDTLLARVEDLNVKVLVNGNLITETTSKGKMYSFQEAIAYASWEEQLHPGELFGSGTIPGCTGIENGVMLHKGDEITLEIEGIGQLTNHVI